MPKTPATSKASLRRSRSATAEISPGKRALRQRETASSPTRVWFSLRCLSWNQLQLTISCWSLPQAGTLTFAFQKAALLRYIDYSASILHLFCIISASIYKNTRPLLMRPVLFPFLFSVFSCRKAPPSKNLLSNRTVLAAVLGQDFANFFPFSHLQRIA